MPSSSELDVNLSILNVFSCFRAGHLDSVKWHRNLSADPVYKMLLIHTETSICDIEERNFFRTLETIMESPKALTNAKFLSLLKSMSLFVLLLMIVSHVFDAPTLSVSVIISPEDRSVQNFFGSKVGQVLCSVAAGEAAYVLVLGMASLCSVTVTIYSVKTASTIEQLLTLNDLSWRILGTWMRFIIIWVYITLISISYAFFMVLLVCYCATAFEDTVFLIMVLLVVFSSLYFTVVRVMSSIVEVVEEDCSEPDSPLSEEESLLSRIEEGYDNDENYDMLNGSRGIRCFKFLLVSAVCGIASYGLVEFGVNEENGTLNVQTASTIASASLFLSVDLLIFMVFVVLFWGLKKAEEERSTWEGSLRMFWLPLAMILTLLALDQKMVFSLFL